MLCNKLESSDVVILSVEIRDPRSKPQPLIEGTLHIIGYEGCPTQGARSLIVSHPTVQTSPVEYVAAVCQPSDLLLSLELVKAHGAALRRRLLQLRELHHRQDFPDQEGRHGLELGHPVGPGNVGFEESQVAEDDEDEFSYETKYGKDVK